MENNVKIGLKIILISQSIETMVQIIIIAQILIAIIKALGATPLIQTQDMK
jgi:hypothetical protein